MSRRSAARPINATGKVVVLDLASSKARVDC